MSVHNINKSTLCKHKDKEWRKFWADRSKAHGLEIDVMDYIAVVWHGKTPVTFSRADHPFEIDVKLAEISSSEGCSLRVSGERR